MVLKWRVWVFLISIILGTVFQIIQGLKQGCWTGDDLTNFPLSNGYVMYCKGLGGLQCIIQAQEC